MNELAILSRITLTLSFYQQTVLLVDRFAAILASFKNDWASLHIRQRRFPTVHLAGIPAYPPAFHFGAESYTSEPRTFFQCHKSHQKPPEPMWSPPRRLHCGDHLRPCYLHSQHDVPPSDSDIIADPSFPSILFININERERVTVVAQASHRIGGNFLKPDRLCFAPSSFKPRSHRSYKNCRQACLNHVRSKHGFNMHEACRRTLMSSCLCDV